MARIWIFIVLSYFFITVSYNILPELNDLDLVNKSLMIIMLALGSGILVVNLSTFWLPMWPIKLLLVIQSIQMSLMNFNTLNPSVILAELTAKKQENYMAMNIIVSVFSTMCVTFNGILINNIFQERKWQLRYCVVAGIFAMNMFCIVFSKFIVHDEMRSQAMATMI